MREKDFYVLVDKIDRDNQRTGKYPWTDLVSSVENTKKAPIELEYLRDDNVMVVKANKSSLSGLDAGNVSKEIYRLLNKAKRDSKMTESDSSSVNSLDDEISDTIFKKMLLVEDISSADVETIRKLIRAELAAVMFELFKKKSIWL